MSAMSGFAAWAERRAERRAQRWRGRAETSAQQLPGWRTAARTRFLVRVHVTALVFALLGSVVQIFWFPFLVPWFFTILIGCVSWTMLRTVINIRDVAPDTELDEYEIQIIRSWQSVAYGWLMLLVFAAATYMVFVSAFTPENVWRWVYSGGIFTYVGMMAANALPTIAYATTFGPVPPPNN